MEKKKRQKRAIHEVDPLVIEETIGGGEETRLIFSTRLNELLSKKEITQENLAKNTELSMSSISSYRNGKAEPKITALNKIAKFLNVSTDYLLGNAKYPSTDPNIKNIIAYTGLSDDAINSLLNVHDPDFDYIPELKPPYIDIINSLFKNGFMTKLFIAFGQFLYYTIGEKNFTRWPPNRFEWDDEFADIAIFHLHKKISTATDEVIDSFMSDFIHSYLRENTP